MIALGTPQTARLQSQIGEALSHIASLDFPDKWEGLIDVSKYIVSCHKMALARAASGCVLRAPVKIRRSWCKRWLIQLTSFRQASM